MRADDGAGGDLHALLEHVDQCPPATSTTWSGWRIQPVSGGANNRIYRASRAGQDLALKFTLADGRDRAGREHRALLTLHRAGLGIAPEPVHLDRTALSQPVSVQRWLAGTVAIEPPQTDREWTALIEHFATLHSVTPERSAVELDRAVVTAYTADEALQLIHAQLERIPAAERPAELERLMAKLASRPLPAWPPVAPVLCRCDPNTRNLIRRAGAWASVDWENSGWGDPAYEIADLLTHPAYNDIPDTRRAWLVERYCARQADPTLRLRIAYYYRTGLLWWVGRFARMLYEIPHGLDERLAPREPDWEATTRAKLRQYTERARTALDEPLPSL